jgi:3-phenylpropionate/cinnamic acid dioxygenase small subunit
MKELSEIPRKSKVYHAEVEVNYALFSNEEKRQEAYHTYARLFLKVKERKLMLRRKMQI